MNTSGDSAPPSANFRELDDVFLQSQTRIWLEEVLQTRLDENTNIFDILADGELLFEVSKVVWRMLLTDELEISYAQGHKSIPFTSRKSGGKYKPYSNVDAFLKVCKVVGLNGVDLFSPSDVVEKRDTRKVCTCIRSFSKSARSKKLNVPDFDVVIHTVTMPTRMVGCIRRSLELSQCSSMSSSSNSSHIDSEMTSQENSAAVNSRDLKSEDSDDAESNYLELGACRTTINMSKDIDQGKQEGNNYQNGLCLAEPAESFCSCNSKNDCAFESMSSLSCPSPPVKLLNATANISDIIREGQPGEASDLVNGNSDLGSCGSSVGNSVDREIWKRVCVDGHLSVPEFKDKGNDCRYTVSDDEDAGLFDALLGSISHGSDSIPWANEGTTKRKFLYDFQDAEESPARSISSDPSRVLNLDFNHLDTIEQFRHPNLQSALNHDLDLVSKTTARMHESLGSMVSFGTDDEQSWSNTEHGENGLSSPCSGMQSHIMTAKPDYHDIPCRISSVVEDAEGRRVSQICNSSYNSSLELEELRIIESFLYGQTGTSLEPSKYINNCTINGDDRPQSFSKTSFSEGFHEEYLHHIQAGAVDVADGLPLQEMMVIPEIEDKGVVDQVASKFLVYTPQEGTFPDNVETENLNPNSSPCRELFEVSEKCHSFGSSSKNGDINFQTSILDSSPQINDELVSVAMENPFLQQKFVSPSGTLESTPENQSCSESLAKSLAGNGHQRCAEKMNDLRSLDDSDCGNNKDNKYNKLVNVEAEISESDGKKDINRKPESMPWGSPLLKSVVGGSAAVIGVVFLFLRVRQGNERGRASGGRGNRLPT